MSERAAQKHTCSQCKGQGVIHHPGASCRNCRGQGFNETVSGEASICPACNGQGSGQSIRPCGRCSGQGYTVGIYEITDYSVACPSCGGTGWFFEEKISVEFYGNRVEQHRLKCPLCHGRGILSEQRFKAIR